MPRPPSVPWFPKANEPNGLARDAQALFAKVNSWQATNLGRAELQQTLPEVILELANTRATDEDLKQKLRAYCYQELALSHYKYDYANPLQAHRVALEELEKAGLRDPNLRDQRTLCLGGAVHKYLYSHGAREQDLERAEGYYLAAHKLQVAGAFARGRDLGLENCGYPGINAAYLLDVRAARMQRNSISTAQREQAEQLRLQALNLRQEILKMLATHKIGQSHPANADEKWDYPVYAEAYFARGSFAEAKRWLQRFLEVVPSEWEKQTCARQLAQLARMHDVPLDAGSAALEVLLPLLGDVEPEHGAVLVSCLLRGKVGLALSGGGHRAALYHIGVLARLADVGALRDVETISTVSGGSIVGVMYYLKLKTLLEQRKDVDIDDESYRRIVREVSDEYVHAVQHNVRMRSIADLWQNMLMLFGRKSHSERMGELYTQYFFGGETKTMHALLITPADAKEHAGAYNPKDYNWRRAAKVPVLMINTTCLNTGHNWHFTATWMGEPPQLRGFEVDKNERLRRVYYEEELKARDANDSSGWPAPTLGAAVAASAGVPGIFPPMPIHGLYKGRVVRLVDGGSHDNQGVQALLADGCKRLLCSDASGQMHEHADPGENRLNVLLRTTNILMDRVREAQLKDIQGRVHSDALALMFVHLRQDLPVREIPWTTSDDEVTRDKHTLTDYTIDRGTQWRLANIRTDLDSFTDVEAHALMCSGYLATRRRLIQLDDIHHANSHPGSYGDYDVHAEGDWPFLALRDALALPSQLTEQKRLNADEKKRVKKLTELLDVGANMVGKTWRLNKLLRAVVKGLGIVLFMAALGLLLAFWGADIPQIQPTKVGAATLALLLFFAAAIAPAVRYALAPESLVRKWALRILVATLGWAVANIHLWLFEPMFLKYGSKKAAARDLFGSNTTLPADPESETKKSRSSHPPPRGTPGGATELNRTT